MLLLDLNYHISILVVFVFNDENGIETRKNGGHKVDILFAFGVVPSTENRVGCREDGAPRIQSCSNSRLKMEFYHVTGIIGKNVRSRIQSKPTLP